MRIFEKEFSKPTALPRAAFLLGSGLATCVVSIGAFGHIQSIPTDAGGRVAENIERGNILPMLLSGSFWSNFPQIPAGWSSALQPSVAGALVALLVVLTLLLRTVGRKPWSTVGAALLLASLAPIGVLAFGPFEFIPEPAAWLYPIVASTLYGGVLALLCAVMDLSNPITAARRRTSQKTAGAGSGRRAVHQLAAFVPSDRKTG